jgi:hypothetical protein
MRSFSVLLGTILAATLAASAATPIANVISADSVAVDGITAPARNYIPVQAGDVVSSKSATAVVRYTDGTTVILQPNSRVKIDTRAGNPDFRVLAGAAQYKLTLNSKAHVTNGSDAFVEKLYDDVSASRGMPSMPPAAVLYTASSSKSGSVILPSASITTGGFLTSAAPAKGLGGLSSLGAVFQAGGVGGSGGPAINLPNGVVINLTPSAPDPTTGIVSYTVASVTTPVTQPDGSTAYLNVSTNSQGQQVVVPVTASGAPIAGAAPVVSASSSPLLGATVTVPTVTAPSTPGNPAPAPAPITVTAVGSSTPLSATQTASAVTSTATTAIATATANGQLPAGTTAPTASPISSGSFSSGS